MKNFITENLALGVCYYPEHWPKELWEQDFKRMKELNFSYVRMAEFAWTVLEPQEGVYDFTLFDEAIEMAAQFDLKVILGTPTATPPVWLTHNYPEVLNAKKDGTVFHPGMRRHYNYNSKKYWEFSEKIVDKLSNHYKNNKNVVGWQIDNELNCEIDEFYSQADHDQFKVWLKNKYTTLNNLNEAWGTVFWNQTYTDWSQVYLTRTTVRDSPNPRQALDEKRFFSDSAIRYADMQAEVIRKNTSNQWITTNGMFGHINNHELTQQALDFYSYDSYPNFHKIIDDKSIAPLEDRKWSFNLSKVRDISNNFAVMEQQSGPGGWTNRIEHPTPKHGQIRLWTYQSIAHGADLITYFRWRTATKGQEMYWHGIYDYGNKENHRVKEITNVSSELENIGKQIAGTQYQAEVALATSYINDWDGENDNWYGNYINTSNEEIFKTMQYHHIPVDIINTDSLSKAEELTKYKTIILPHFAIITESLKELLQDYAVNGGTLIFGARSGYKNEHGQTRMLPFPGNLRDLTGVEITNFTRLNFKEPSKTIRFDQSKDSLEINDFAEVLEPINDKAQVIASYEDDEFEHGPAITKHAIGSGKVYYCGAVFNQNMFYALLKESNNLLYNQDFELPSEVEYACRKDVERNYYFILNFSGSSKKIKINSVKQDLHFNKEIQGEVELEKYGVMILTDKS